MKEKMYIPNEKLLDAAQGSVYKLTMLVAKRALQLVDEEKPLIDGVPYEKVLEIALREIEQKKIRVKTKSPK